MSDIMQVIKSLGNSPVRLHLGCGPKYLEGYINVDIPEDQPLSKVKVDFEADILCLNCDENCIDEIRLHHTFEHFDRIQALSLLVKWSLWLKVGGILHISTPDSEGEMRKFCSSNSFLVKMLAVRHMIGSHEAAWGRHLDLWFEERFFHTFSLLGFGSIQANKISREDGFFDIDVLARKVGHLSLEYLFKQAISLLRESAVLPIEEPMVDVWKEALRKYLY